MSHLRVAGEGDAAEVPSPAAEFAVKSRAMLEKYLNRGAFAILIIAEMPGTGVEFDCLPDSEALARGMIGIVADDIFPDPSPT